MPPVAGSAIGPAPFQKDKLMPRFLPVRRPSAFRLLAASSWQAPRDPTVLSMFDVEYTAVAAFLERYNRSFDAAVTPTHLVGRAAGLLMPRYPEANAIVGWSGIKQRQGADVFFMIENGNGRNLTGHKIEGVDTQTLAEIARELGQTARDIRAGHDKAFGKSHDNLRRLPLWLARPAARVMTGLNHRFGLDLSPLGPKPDAFGGAIITSLARFGIDTAFPALVPFAQTAVIVAIMPVQTMPCVVGDTVEPRPVLRICCTTDHRIIDGYTGGMLMRDLKALLADPVQLLTEAEAAQWQSEDTAAGGGEASR
jgi:pyruvate/2-oxoglutarate dehydrogenase complex dihydrolipoamide acyltransferase (E2) component